MEPQTPKTKAELLLDEAVKTGFDASPEDLAADEVACAESYCRKMQKVIPEFPTILGTYSLLMYLQKSPWFESTLDPEPGVTIICATGTGNGSMRGHVAVITKDRKIAGNNSPTGTWEENSTLDRWRERYQVKGGFRSHLFKLKG